MPGSGANPPPSSLPSSHSCDESSRMMTVPKSLGSAVVTMALGFTSMTPVPVTVTFSLSTPVPPGTTRTAQPLPVASDGGFVVGQVIAGGTVVVVVEFLPGTWVYAYVIFQLPAA